MPTLYDLANEYLEVLDLANDPEIPPDVVADTLEAIGGDIETKAENTAKILKELESSAAAAKAEEKRLSERRKQLETKCQKSRNDFLTLWLRLVRKNSKRIFSPFPSKKRRKSACHPGCERHVGTSRRSCKNHRNGRSGGNPGTAGRWRYTLRPLRGTW